jgi:biopolymer transport protein ExbB
MKVSQLISVVALGLGLGLSIGTAQDFGAVASGAKKELETALMELAAAQEKISAEKIPLAREMNMAEEAVLAKKKKLEAKERDQSNQMVDLGVLKNQVKGRKEQLEYLGGLLSEFSQAFESRLHATEISRHTEQLRAARAAAENESLTPVESLAQQAALIGLALDRAAALLGGESFPGTAVAGGVRESGKFALFGPVAVFSAEGADAVGLARGELNAEEVHVTAAPESLADGIRAITHAGIGVLPVDTSMGDAEKIAATEETFWEHARKGGPTMVPLLGLGALALIIGCLKYVQIGFISLARPRDIQIIVDRVNAGNMSKAHEQAKRIRGPVGEMLNVAIDHATERKEYIEEVLYEKMLKVRPGLESWLPVVPRPFPVASLKLWSQLSSDCWWLFRHC